MPKQVWFLTGSQHLYGPETLAQVDANSRRLAARLDAAGLPVGVAWQPVLTGKEAIRDAILAANADPDCVGAIAWMHTFSPAKMWIAGLEALQVPLLHLHTQANDELPWASIDMDFMNLNQAAHGDREFASVETRLGVARKTVTGSLNDPAVVAKVDRWARAALAWDAGRRARLVRFGDNMRDVAVTEGDKVEAERIFGMSVNTYGVNDLVEAIGQVSDAEAEALAADYEDLYDVAEELRAGGERHASLVYGARQELGMRSFLEGVQATAFTTNFEDLGALEQLPGLAVQRLTAEGYGFGAEGDWKTAMLVRLAKVMGDGLSGGASLMEDYTYNLVPGREVILGAHMLEVCPSLTTAKPSLEIHPLGIGGRDDPVRLVFTADPGPGVVVGLADLGERFRLTMNVVENVVPEQPLPKLPVARAVWRPAPDFHTATECWLVSGAPHHTCMFTAPGARELFEDYAAIAGVELAVIDEATTSAGFARELRWEAAYHRLARGL
ncbi:MAG: L-arabinose isomerase [Propionibacteriaceae bacterium]|jgi:L-arabinose isomerase|nr:L-arabinose isomerase [Propionibacteriaceae bacterium]